MKKIVIGIVGLVVVCVLLIVLFGIYKFNFTDGGDAVPKNDAPLGIACTQEAMICPDGSTVGRTGSKCEFAPCPSLSEKRNPSEFIAPLDRASERVTKKPFGILIDRMTSPVQPERFSGYHTGTDFETFSEEQAIDVSIRAVCTGTIIEKKQATGYGGVIVERCQKDAETVTVVYGHLALKSIGARVGETIEQGSIVGVLGAAKSAETDGERKHLHLSIHKGSQVDIHGYVSSQKELGQWIDPCLFVCK